MKLRPLFFRILFFISLDLSLMSTSIACMGVIKLKDFENVGVSRCLDNTISYDEPLGKSHYEGMCGPVAAANSFYAYCDESFVDPMAIAQKYFYDFTPGVRPQVLATGLNRLYGNNQECLKGEWNAFHSKDRWDYLNALFIGVRRGFGKLTRLQESGGSVIRSPMLALLTSTGKNLHWVTLVDVMGYRPEKSFGPRMDLHDYKREDCRVVFNHQGYQSNVSCLDFVERAEGVVDQMSVGLFISKYTYLMFNPM